MWLAVGRGLWALKHENLLVLFEHNEWFTGKFYVLKVLTPVMERFYEELKMLWTIKKGPVKGKDVCKVL